MRASHFMFIALISFLLVLAGAQPLAAQGTPIEPVKSFPDIPPLPKSSSEVKARYGPITDSDGNTDKGDRLTQKVNRRVLQWEKDFKAQAQAQESQYMKQAMNPYGAGAMNANSGRVLGRLQSTTAKLQGEQQQTAQAYRDAEGKLENRYDQQVKQLDHLFMRKAERAGCWGTTPQSAASCAPVRKAWSSALLKAGDTYLSSLATPFGEMRIKMKGEAAQAQSVLDQADKTLGPHRPLIVQGLYRGLLMNAIEALQSTNTAENDAVVLVYQKSVRQDEVPK